MPDRPKWEYWPSLGGGPGWVKETPDRKLVVLGEHLPLPAENYLSWDAGRRNEFFDKVWAEQNPGDAEGDGESTRYRWGAYYNPDRWVREADQASILSIDIARQADRYRMSADRDRYLDELYERLQGPKIDCNHVGMVTNGYCGNCNTVLQEDSPEDESCNKTARMGTDAEKWANEFIGQFTGKYAVMGLGAYAEDPREYVEIHPGSALHGMVRDWFADAIEAGLSLGRSESRPIPAWGLPESLEQWWMKTAEADLASVLPKMQEYGSYDLVAVGEMLAHVTSWDDVTDEQKTELGCWFYLLGKVARAFDAVRQHRLPSDDTAYDIYVYAQMVRRIREHGSWS